MAFRFKGFSTVLFSIASVVYPVLVFYFLVIRQAPLRMFSLVVIAIALLGFIAGTSKKKVNQTQSPGRLLFCSLWALRVL